MHGQVIACAANKKASDFVWGFFVGVAYDLKRVAAIYILSIQAGWLLRGYHAVL